MADEDERFRLTARLTEAFGEEIGRRDLDAPIPWPDLPDLAALIGHLGGVHRWVVGILRTGRSSREDREGVPTGEDPRQWYEEGRVLLLETLADVPAATPCWIIGASTGTAAFWRRRMVYENVKHLTDVRASGTGWWQVADELMPHDYADGIDEVFAVFLARSRPKLRPLPGSVTLEATDTGDRWRIGSDWTVGGGQELDGPGSVRINATAGDLALAVWERADPLHDPARFRVDGAPATVAAFVATSIHPW